MDQPVTIGFALACLVLTVGGACGAVIVVKVIGGYVRGMKP